MHCQCNYIVIYCNSFGYNLQYHGIYKANASKFSFTLMITSTANIKVFIANGFTMEICGNLPALPK